MNLKKFGNFNWMEMNSKDQNLDLTRIKRIHFCPFQFIFVGKLSVKWIEMAGNRFVLFVSNPDSDFSNSFLSN